MSHYWAGDDPAEVRRAQAEDWIDDLIEFDPKIVADSCAQWRREMSRRPTPADIRKLAIAEQGDQRITVPVDMEAYAKRLGWGSAAEREAEILEARRLKAQRRAELDEQIRARGA